MSLVRVITDAFIGKRLKTFRFDPIGIVSYICSNEGRELIAFLRDVQSGKAIDSYEAKELQGSEELCSHIGRDEIVYLLTGLLYDKKQGEQMRETVWQHRHLVHAMYYNEKYMLDQFSKIIRQLELTAKDEEKKKGGIHIISPQVGGPLEGCGKG